MGAVGVGRVVSPGALQTWGAAQGWLLGSRGSGRGFSWQLDRFLVKIQRAPCPCVDSTVQFMNCPVTIIWLSLQAQKPRAPASLLVFKGPSAGVSHLSSVPPQGPLSLHWPLGPLLSPASQRAPP